jgi:catechol 2,3-dioxygenase-like lactoylglutathione lyase family enzyme
MFADTKAYSGIAVNDLQQAREFYGETLGLKTSEEHGLMWLHLAGGRDTLVYRTSPGSRTRPATSCPSFKRGSAASRERRPGGPARQDEKPRDYWAAAASAMRWMPMSMEGWGRLA